MFRITGRELLDKIIVRKNYLWDVHRDPKWIQNYLYVFKFRLQKLPVTKNKLILFFIKSKISCKKSKFSCIKHVCILEITIPELLDKTLLKNYPKCKSIVYIVYTITSVFSNEWSSYKTHTHLKVWLIQWVEDDGF